MVRGWVVEDALSGGNYSLKGSRSILYEDLTRLPPCSVLGRPRCLLLSASVMALSMSPKVSNVALIGSSFTALITPLTNSLCISTVSYTHLTLPTKA